MPLWLSLWVSKPRALPPQACPSIRTIAEASGVSLNTVSLALRGSPRVKAATRAKILAFAKDFGYRPNLIARSMATGKSKLIGVLIPGHDFSYLPLEVESMQNAATEAGLGLLILSSRRVSCATMIAEQIEFLLQRRVDGVIVHPPTPILPKQVWEPLRGIPTVWVGVGGSAEFGRNLVLRPEEAGKIGSKELLRRGCRRFAYAGPTDDFFSQRRWAGVAAVFKQRGAQLPLHWPTSDSVGGGVEAAARWLAMSPRTRPDALLGFTDAIAVGFLHHLIMHGHRIPSEVSVLGVDDTPIAAAAAIPLTTLRAPVHTIGRLAVQSLCHPEVELPKVKWEWIERATARPTSSAHPSRNA